MSSNAHSSSAVPSGWRGLVQDWSGDRTAFKVSWGKAMMWIFLLSDTFVFSCFLTGYMTVRSSTTVPWPNSSHVFSLHVGGADVPLLLIAIMTFVLITSSGTMALAVNHAYRRDRATTFKLMLATGLLGATFVGMQAFEWTKLIVDEGIRPWGNPMGAAQFGAVFFMITGFHGLHVSLGVIYLLIVAIKVRRGDYEKRGYQIVEIAGLYWHFVDLVWVFIFALFYLW
ncbi:heme-copper oxidase subunit III family protein [Roseateles microcysteis]|uniref:heme-copper oxidase subunit III family protein n=1 Tax=Roseateles microcysteis TaxID=3119057 RepID=UPI002FE51F82